MFKFNRTINTNGTGYWSNVVKAVNTTKLVVSAFDDSFGELMIYFDKSWNVKKDGLIYTDKQFMTELRAQLIGAGFTKAEANDVDYSEQGMQGENYVSCDVGKKFLKAWNKKLDALTPIL